MYLRCLVIFFIVFLCLSTNANTSGLHLQIGDATIDFNKNNIEQMQIFQSGQGLASAMLRLKPSAAANLYKLTEKNIGQQILWIWNGRVLCTQKLQEPLQEDITVHNFTSFEAEDFSKYLGFFAN